MATRPGETSALLFSISRGNHAADGEAAHPHGADEEAENMSVADIGIQIFLIAELSLAFVCACYLLRDYRRMGTE